MKSFLLAMLLTGLPPQAQHKTELIFPLLGAWHVTNGGSDPALNGHSKSFGQEYALDILKVNRHSMKSCESECKLNKNYYAFGELVIAPADGFVTDVTAGVADNSIVGVREELTLGNAVIIRHRPGEASLFAHLKNGSIKVCAGQTVKQGQIIGLVGNSGNSTEPHLHYNLQSSSYLHEASSIQAWFKRVWVVADNKYIKRDYYAPSGRDNIYSPKQATSK